MTYGIAGIRVWAALLMLLMCAVGGPASAAEAEAYFSLERMKVPFGIKEAHPRLLVVDLDLAVTTVEDKAKLRKIRDLIKTEIEAALGAMPVIDFESGNLALIVKHVALTAARRAAGAEIKINDALIRGVRLI